MSSVEKSHKSENPKTEGSLSLQNCWLDHQGFSYEVPLYSDVCFTSEILEGFGCYEVINLINSLRSDAFLLPSVMLRMENNISGYNGEVKLKTQDTLYHGGGIEDEVAALLSLAFGRRFAAGDITREFRPGSDPRGRPLEWFRSEGHLIYRVDHRTPLIPESRTGCKLSLLPVLKNFKNLIPKSTVPLVKAARLYQEGLLVADSDPNLAWLRFVSAIETAANFWRSEKEPAVDRLESSAIGDKIKDFLKQHNIESSFPDIADILKDNIGATRKFVDFIIEHLPDIPPTRPNEAYRIDWTTEKLQKGLKKVYAYRSIALHAGKPFPAPMCEAPFKSENFEYYPEKPIGLSATHGSSTWNTKDLPMHLHIFEYIVRGSLINWWEKFSAT